MLTIDPFASASSARKAMQVRKVPVRLTSRTFTKVSISNSLSRARIPAQLTSASTRLYLLAKNLTGASSVASSVPSVMPARGLRSVRARSASWAPVAVTVAPRSQNWLLIAAPMSPAPPITTAWKPGVREKFELIGRISLQGFQRRSRRLANHQRKVDLAMHDGLLTGEAAHQIFAGALPGLSGRNVDRGQARPQMAAPVEVVEAND